MKQRTIVIFSLLLASCVTPKIENSPIAMCGAGLDDGINAGLTADLKNNGGNISIEFLKRAKAALNPNDVTDQKYNRYIDCVLEIDKRNRTTLTEFENINWLTAQEYQKEFDLKSSNGYYPRTIQGVCESGGEKLKAEWQQLPLGATFYSHHTIKKDEYEKYRDEYIAKGFVLLFSNNFKDCSGVDRYQATWIKTP